ncbi:glycosyltransferase [Rosenbergiella epipactidis]|uniref:glycosyltransferase n=1 Tax=Rosenbergiella epipactidis TaxID=1544694 RepID=UPI001F4EB2EA|nr:glycosyltransferase [Rosenbergiella epipactidis]
MEKVTVYITTHNRVDMLARALISVQKQTYNNLEIIISDDGSTDGTEDYVNNLLINGFENLFYLRSDMSKGACNARNLAISHATGYYITGLDDDDEFTEGRVEELVSFYEKNEGISFVSSSIKKISKNGITIDYRNRRKINSQMLKKSNCVGNQILTKTQYLRDIGGFDVELPAWQDYDCWFRLVEKYGAGMNCAIVNYVMHTEHELPRVSISGKVKNALDIFISKHKSVLTLSDIKGLVFNFNLYYTDKHVLKNLIDNFSLDNFIKSMKFLVKNIL